MSDAKIKVLQLSAGGEVPCTYRQLCVGGYQGVLTEVTPDGRVPLVRSLHEVEGETYRFDHNHKALARYVETEAQLPSLSINNLLVKETRVISKNEHFRAFQCQDLDPVNGMVCILSLYYTETPSHLRVLQLRDKRTREITEYPLQHNSLVVIPLALNATHVHRIITHFTPREYKDQKNQPSSMWLGVEFRQAMTFLRYRDGQAFLLSSADDGTSETKLRQITEDYEDEEYEGDEEDEWSELYKLRRAEKQRRDPATPFVWPFLDYTTHPQDIKRPPYYLREVRHCNQLMHELYYKNTEMIYLDMDERTSFQQGEMDDLLRREKDPWQSSAKPARRYSFCSASVFDREVRKPCEKMVRECWASTPQDLLSADSQHMLIA